MKKLITSLLIALIASSAVMAQKSYDQFQIQVDGLGCPFCAYGLEKKFKEFKGIKKITIDIETGNFKFQYPSDTTLSMSSVVDQVKEAGYTPKDAVIKRADGALENFSSNQTKKNNPNQAQQQLAVYGNCDMCKSRIEAAALAVNGVTFALWNTATKKLIYQTDTAIPESKIAQNIANSGHDSSLAKAPTEVYNNLPPCCTYRKK